MKNKRKIPKHLIIASLVSLIIVTAVTIGNIAAFRNYHVVTAFMSGPGLNQNSKEAITARESGNELAVKISEEGVVLLKNKGNALPLKTNKVNVFGFAGSNDGFIPQGTGSGTGSRNDLVTFLEGLEEAGLEYNEELAEAYDDLDYSRVDGGYVIEAYTDELYKKYYGVLEAPNNFYDDDRMLDAREYSDTAIIVLGRLLGEGNDYSKKQYVANDSNDSSRKLQSISEREEYMISQVCNYFDNVILVLNITNSMELGFVDDYDIDAVLQMGLPGTRGTIGVGNILAGKVSPSGRLADTWAYDLATAPSYATSGREGVGSYLDISKDTTLGTRANKYTDYLEDIYVGYKWYETADIEGYWDDKGGYDKIVQYPFGYGLSYTDFKWTIIPKNIKNADTLTKTGNLEFEVWVENIGDFPGRDVVEMYYSAPYYKGGIEKSAVNLGAFAKTEILQPGQVEILKIEMDVETMKSYDVYDRNNNGFMGYELEEGQYTISFRTDSHTLAEPAYGNSEYEFNVPTGGYKYETDSVTGEVVKNQFTTYTNLTSGASSVINEQAVNNAHSIDGSEEPTKITYLTRADFAGTFPYEKPENRNAGDDLIDDAHYVLMDPINNPDDVAPETGSKATSWTIQDLFGVEYDDPLWDELVSQLPLETQARLLAQGGFGTIEIESIGKPRTADADGPAGFNNAVIGQGNLKAVCYPSATVIAQTWNWYIAYQKGVALGIEANALNIQGWYGPGGNLHRTPTGGRNFEYYSEDPRLSGTMLAYEVLGAKERGVTAYIKHIAVNETDSGRNGAYKWLTEQNLRENYLLPFEMAVKIGKSNGMMSSVDRVGSTRASESYAMLTAVLRDEWGFRGTVITDYYQNAGKSKATDTTHDVDAAVRAGNSQLLFQDQNPGLSWFNDASSATAKKAIAKSTKDILFAYADTLHFSETTQGLEKGSMIGESVEVFAWWVIVLVALDVILAGLLTFWVYKAAKGYRKAIFGAANNTVIRE